MQAPQARESFEFGGRFVWEPDEETIRNANLTRFMEMHEIPDYGTLMQRSTDDVGWFTASVLNFLKIEFYEPYRTVVDLSRGIQLPEWCVGGNGEENWR